MVDVGPGYKHRSVGASGRDNQMEVWYVIKGADRSITVQ